MERVSITLMNRALDPTFREMSQKELKDRHYFSVQSEREVWPIASFQVPKESHAVLDWVFKKTKIHALIEAQNVGRLLQVPEIGDFKVQWHLSADMKSIKVMYGLKHGANCVQTCIYCNQERSKPVVTIAAQAVMTLSKKTQSWSGGLFSTSVHAKPLIGARALNCWKPILQIPLDRVHICMLHALNRIVEKILHLHFIFVWTMRDKEQLCTTLQHCCLHASAHLLHALPSFLASMKPMNSPQPLSEPGLSIATARHRHDVMTCRVGSDPSATTQ
jgi:hypothetical protein